MRFLPACLTASFILLSCADRAGAIEKGTREKPHTANLKPGQYVWDPKASQKGAVDIIVDLSAQKLRVYRDGVLIGRSTISSGSKGRETPKGIYMILQKNLTHHSNKYHEASMPYMERLTWDGLAIHAGNTPGHPESHGCMHVPMNFAKDLYTVTQEGNTVLVAGGIPKPTTTPDPNLLLAAAPGDVPPPPAATPGPSPNASPSPSPDASPATNASPAPDAPPAPNASPAPDASPTPNASPAPDASPPPPGPPPFIWKPRDVPFGPVSIVFASIDKRVYVYRKGVEIGQADLGGPGAGQPHGNYVYAALDQTLPDGLHPWSLLGSGDGSRAPNLQDLAQSLTLPTEFRQHLRELATPGTTLVITDHPANPTKPTHPD